MFFKVLLLVLVVGVLYKYVSHGCGPACHRNPEGYLGQRGVRAECACVCATCPCSPLDGVFEAFDSIPSMDTCQNIVKEWISARCNRPAIQRHAQYSDTSLFPSPIVIEEAMKCRSRSSEPFLRTEAAFRDPDPNSKASAPSFKTSLTQAPEAGGRCDAGMSACGRGNPNVICECASSSKLRRTSRGIKKDDSHAAMMSETCNKCKAKGLTCIGSCPKAKRARSVGNNTGE